MELKIEIVSVLKRRYNGDDFDSQNSVGHKPLVIYFYPKDNTPGCTTPSSFRDQYEDFKDLGAEVIGISSDSVESHQKFSKQYKLPFILLSDADKNSEAFGVPSGVWVASRR
jgi:peroxiredoxin Q/BCP